MKNVNLLILLFLTFINLSSCSSIETEPKNSSLNNVKVRSGQHFGFCIGKCFAEMEISNNTIVLTVKERQARGSSTQDVVYSYNEALTATQTKNIEAVLNLNTFSKLENVYGCPDCADGGSEWIEIEQSKDNIKRVTFEFGKTIPEIDKLIVLLRKERTTLIEKYTK